MIRIEKCTNTDKVIELIGRGEEQNANVDNIVSDIIANVRKDGDIAVLEYTKRFDKADISALEVSREEITNALKTVSQGFLAILKEAASNIENYHSKQKRSGFMSADKPGVFLGQKITPLDRVGIYVPGGTAAYPSTVLMDCIPAKIAGVPEIIMTTPPNANGKIPEDILAAAAVAGVDRIFKVGGAQAVAALAYGTQSIPKVDKIVGPGNIFVATAKRMVYGTVDIDMIAGPSEILIIADNTANAEYTAVDLLSQAEHDKLAASILVTTDEAFAGEVAQYIEQHLKTLPRQEIARTSIENNGIIIVTDSLKTAAEISNRIAPEHLEIVTKEPFELLALIRHAGSIFMGGYSPEALGDYFAGPNHTLPTSGTARFSSGLSVDDFIKKSSVIYYSKDALLQVADKIAAFAEHEGLGAHARSVTIRQNNEGEAVCK